MAYRIYVGTYAKYNKGSLKGKWFDLEDYGDKDDFLKDIAEFHKDEDDPEFMFQDWEGVPEKYISESYIDADFWDDFLGEDEDNREIVEAFWEHVYDDPTPDEVMDKYFGRYESKADFAYEWLNEMGGEKIPEFLEGYIDYDAYARDMEMSGFEFVPDGNYGIYVFTS